MDLERRMGAFSRLGVILREMFDRKQEKTLRETPATENLREKATTASQYNGWFTQPFVFRALYALGESLREPFLDKWINTYTNEFQASQKSKVVGVVMAGNVPAVGFHDFLSVLVSGHKIQAKLSSDDNKLLPAIAKVLVEIEPGFSDYISFTEKTLKGFDAIIATGSNNTSRYFEYYFGKYPHIIRKNRNGVAVLTGNESEKQLQYLADDVFLYYGLGCRNVSKIFVPEGYDFSLLLKVFSERKEIIENHKYFNNYEYNKAVFLVNKQQHLDAGNILLTEEDKFASPVGVLYYEYFKNPDFLRNRLHFHNDQIQCIVSEADFLKEKIPFGKSQIPDLWDYADGVDTLKFLLSLK